jgi:hypothetical protein
MPERGRNDHDHAPHVDGEYEGIINDALATGSGTVGVRVDINPFQPTARKNAFEVEEVKVDSKMKEFRSMMEGEKR